jgi:ribosomal protein S18 acetylase RimI-like enzyme
MTEHRAFQIRKFEPADRSRVRELCCATGFLGKSIAPVFEDLEIFADYLTAYYTDREPESSFVLLVNGEIRGYLLGSRHPARQGRFNRVSNLSLALRGLVRYRRYNPASRKFVQWILRQAWREVPAAPRDMAHFHINLLPDARQLATTSALVDAYLAYLYEHGEKAVYGQMVVFEERRGARLFERFGFEVLNKAEITKYRDVYPGPVYLCTVVKDLTSNPRLSARK